MGDNGVVQQGWVPVTFTAQELSTGHVVHVGTEMSGFFLILRNKADMRFKI